MNPKTWPDKLVFLFLVGATVLGLIGIFFDNTRLFAAIGFILSLVGDALCIIQMRPGFLRNALKLKVSWITWYIVIVGSLLIVDIGSFWIYSNANSHVVALYFSYTPTPPTPPPGFKGYSNSDESFWIAYPKDWQVHKSDQGVGAVFQGSNQQTLEVSNYGSLASDPTAFDEGICQTKEFGGQLSPPKHVDIGGQQWTQEECDNVSGTLHGVVEAVIYENAFYFFIYSSPKPDFADDKIWYFQPMETTFQFSF